MIFNDRVLLSVMEDADSLATRRLHCGPIHDQTMPKKAGKGVEIGWMDTSSTFRQQQNGSCLIFHRIPADKREIVIFEESYYW